MKIYDQHMHSKFSFDCEEPLEKYLKKFPGHSFCTTDHLDLKNPLVDFEDSAPDYTQYSAYIDHLAQQFSVELYKGIEIGYTRETQAAIAAYLSNKEFAIKLLSVHQNGRYDYMAEQVATVATEALIKEYYMLMIDALESPLSFDIFAHFDYGLRKKTVTVTELEQFGRPILEKVLTLVIKNELAFELNTKSIYKYQKVLLYDYVVDKYLALGGRLFTLGSDAHTADNYGYKFAEAIQFLKNKGVQEIVHYQKNTRTCCSLQELEVDF